MSPALRFFTVYGPRQRPEMAIHKFTRRILEGEEIDLYGDGSYRRDCAYLEDIVPGVLGALTAPPGYRVYNLGESATISDLVALIEKVCGKGARATVQAAAARRRPRDVRGDLPREIGYDPRTPIDRGVALFVDWYREQAAAEADR